jgi:competence protein ComFC
MGLLDILFPKYCVQCKKFGEYICADCFSRLSFTVEHICLVCNKPAIDGRTHPVCLGKYTIDGAFASVTYTGVVKKLVYQFKYKPFIQDLQHTLSDLLYEGIIQQEQFHRLLQKDPVLIPIPLHPEKERQRGYNQARLLADNLGKRLNLATISVLKRIKKTHIQADLPREKRQENMHDAFTYERNAQIEVSGRTILLLDDIITTGSTMMEACKVLKKNGAKTVWGIALAHGK